MAEATLPPPPKRDANQDTDVKVDTKADTKPILKQESKQDTKSAAPVSTKTAAVVSQEPASKPEPVERAVSPTAKVSLPSVRAEMHIVMPYPLLWHLHFMRCMLYSMLLVKAGILA